MQFWKQQHQHQLLIFKPLGLDLISLNILVRKQRETKVKKSNLSFSQTRRSDELQPVLSGYT